MIFTLSRALNVFREYLKESGYAESTISNRVYYLKRFFEYLGPVDIREVGRKDIHAFLTSLTDTDLKQNSKRMLHSSIKVFFRALYVKEIILVNPAEDSFSFLTEKKETKVILSETELAGFLDNVDITKPLGLRDRTIFELLYATGMRSGEAARLRAEDIKRKSRTILIRHTKNRRDRVVPVTETAMEFLTVYLGRRKGGPVFLGETGVLQASSMNKRFKKHLADQGIYRKGLTIHSLRHSAAVHLLQNGADIRYVQELLGHDSLESTVIYTHQLQDELKRIYRTYHPRENRYYSEVDEEYRRKIEVLKTLIARKENTGNSMP